MQLKIQRSQRTTGFRGIPVFQLHAIVDVTPAERAMIQNYGLANNIVYASEQWQQNTAMAQQGGTGGGVLRGLRGLAGAALSLKITIADLVNGKRVECKSLDEMIDTENALITGCQILKEYLEVAATFDGREVLIEI
jgi:hypothetical protein